MLASMAYSGRVEAVAESVGSAVGVVVPPAAGVALTMTGISVGAGVRLANAPSTAKAVAVEGPAVGAGGVIVTTPGRSLGLQEHRNRTQRAESREKRKDLGMGHR